MTVTIRPVEQRDASAVTALIRQLGYERGANEVGQWIEALPNRSGQVVYVACGNEEVVGWIEVSVVYHLQEAAFALIGGLVVKDGARGLGIGRLLCERAEAWAWTQGVETLRVTSRSTRPDAHRFYLRDGYTLMKTSFVFQKSRPAQI